MEGFRYRAWPRPALQPDYVSPLTLPFFLVSLGMVVAVLCLPVVARVTSVPPASWCR